MFLYDISDEGGSCEEGRGEVAWRGLMCGVMAMKMER